MGSLVRYSVTYHNVIPHRNYIVNMKIDIWLKFCHWNLSITSRTCHAWEIHGLYLSLLFKYAESLSTSIELFIIEIYGGHLIFHHRLVQKSEIYIFVCCLLLLFSNCFLCESWQLYPVKPSFEEPVLFSLERAAAPYFGIKVCSFSFPNNISFWNLLTALVLVIRCNQ